MATENAVIPVPTTATTERTILKSAWLEWMHQDALTPHAAKSTSRSSITNILALKARTTSAAFSTSQDIWGLSYHETSRHKGQFCIGCCSVFLVVFSVAVMLTIITVAPVVFVTIAEQWKGETDLTVVPRWGSGWARLNYTRVAQVLRDHEAFSLHAPRYSSVGGGIWNPKSCNGWNPLTPTDNAWTYDGPADNDAKREDCRNDPNTCINSLCTAGWWANAWVIDTEKERRIDVGRSWTLPPVPVGSVYLGKRISNGMGLHVGDWVMWQHFTEQMPTVNAYVKEQVENATGQTIDEIDVVNVPLRVAAIFDENSSNKFPQENRDDNLMLLELGTILETVAPYYAPQYPQEFRDGIVQASRKGHAYHEVFNIIFSRTTPRYIGYLGGSWQTLARQYGAWGSELSFRLGYDFIEATYDVLTAMQNNDTIAQFLSLLTTMLVILLCALSCFLIYNLLMVSVETRTFDLGVLRMVGQKRWQTIATLCFQALTYSIPAWVTGLLLAQLLFAVGKVFAERALRMSMRPKLAPSAIAIATALGLIVPLVSAIVPIRQALHANLRDSLDKRQNKLKATVVTIERSSQGSLRDGLPYAVAGILMAGLGFTIYYLLPLALVSRNMELMFDLFIGLLIGMLLGLVLLASNFQPLAERVLLRGMFLVFFWESGAMHRIIKKNLLAHRRRNKKTATMFSFGLGFLIFLSVSFQIQVNGMRFGAMHSIAGDIKVASEETDDQGVMKPMTKISTLNEICESNRPFVKDWAFTTWGLYRLSNSVQNTQIENVGRLAQYSVDVVGVTSNFFNLPKPGEKIMVEGDRNPVLNGGMSATEELYTPEGRDTIILSTFLKSALGLEAGGRANYSQPLVLQVTTDTGSTDRYLRPLAFVDEAPYLRMTKFPATSRTAVAVSFPTYMNLSGGLVKSIDNIPFKSMHISVDRDHPDYDSLLTQVVNKLNDAIRNTDNRLLDLRHELEGYENAERIVSFVFVGTMFLVMVIALLSLAMCMLANTFEQSKEIGVLRALGVRRGVMFRIYVYESFVVTVAAGGLGIIMGTITGWSMCAQQATVSQLPLTFPFPWTTVIGMMVAAMFSAVITTAGPMQNLLFKRKIVSVLKD
ncbi:hypothetical protein HK097_009124 [Rhizophlyctis rosea]|uniref:ABC3 transporter permease C-terminal domain-containing protein n=1 Tax=Rhizophlyctis rosea TaxID=64517 RepID=A0AAD5SJE9_9FUNG|nr:hypothetical protein HK097_009124 [Rhizophlyctis rosea]